MLTPLEPWIADKIGLPPGVPGAPLTAEALRAYQLSRLKETVDFARASSPFYRERLGALTGDDLRDLNDIARFPFTTSADILGDALRLLCVSQSEIERVVTLCTSGTTGEPKRLFFTAGDLDLTVEFFRHGMSTLVSPGQRVLILMPGELPGSVGDLLQHGLARMGVEGIVHGIVRDPRAVIAEICAREIDCLVGLPVQVLGLVRHPDAATIPAGRIKSVLLSTDYVPAAIVCEIERVWGAPVFNHYGMTEMGLGGGVDCQARCGYHLREADLYFEVVDPESGLPLPEGEQGEVVFTTLTRTGMPLIRYRTGDLSGFVPGQCACGTVLRRLGWAGGRIAERARVGDGEVPPITLGITDLDEALFPLPGLLEFGAELVREDGRDTLRVTLVGEAVGEAGANGQLLARARQALHTSSALAEIVERGSLRIAVEAAARVGEPSNGSIKRVLHDRRRSTPC